MMCKCTLCWAICNVALLSQLEKHYYPNKELDVVELKFKLSFYLIPVFMCILLHDTDSQLNYSFAWHSYLYTYILTSKGAGLYLKLNSTPCRTQPSF